MPKPAHRALTSADPPAEHSAAFPLAAAMAAYRDGASLRDIAASTGWHHSRVHAHLIAAGVTMRPAGQGRPTRYDLPAAKIAKAYRDGTSLVDLAAQYGCRTTSPIKRALAEAWRLAADPDTDTHDGTSLNGRGGLDSLDHLGTDTPDLAAAQGDELPAAATG